MASLLSSDCQQHSDCAFPPTMLNNFPLAESMILLGSIERTELQAICDWWLSPERRAFERGQSSLDPASKVSWESFTFVDEEGREEGADKVEKTCNGIGIYV